MNERIDVHHHLLPVDYVRWLHAQGITDAGGWQLPQWSTMHAIDAMDQRGINAAVLSLSAPGVHLGDASTAATWARRVNEFAAECAKDHPDRFGFFATLTLPDVDGALDAANYAFDELSADGVVLLANSRGSYLGSPGFDPLMAELDRRGAVVFVHPTELPGPAAPGIPRSRPISCSTPPARRSTSSATTCPIAIPASGSSSPTPVGSCPTPCIASP